MNFIEKSKKVHGNKYDYSKVNYINSKTKVCIICPEHGEFWQTPDKHAHAKQGCPKCSYIINANKNRLTTEQFIVKAKKVHGDKYDYSKVNYINSQTKVCIICPIHGDFYQKANSHLQGQECPKCGSLLRKRKRSSTIEQFIEKARKVHGDKYDYSKVEYINNQTKICIICSNRNCYYHTRN